MLTIGILVPRRYAKIARCSGHSSYITHLDFSADGRLLQSCCGAYELLYFETDTGKQVCSCQARQSGYRLFHGLVVASLIKMRFRAAES